MSEGDLDRLDAALAVRERPSQPDARASRADRAVAMGLIGLLVLSLFTVVAYMGIGISGEKQARVTEVIVSAIRPQAWMDGKVAAYTVIGILQAAVWAITVVGVVVYLTASLPPAVSLPVLGLTLAFTLVGYAFYTALFALVMATIKDLQSTSKFQAYLVFLPFIPLMILEPVVRTPDATWVVALSQLPLFSPMLIPARFAVGGIAAWEPATALLLLVASFHLVRLAAGHAFRVAMLMYGKELTLPELLRWSREA